MFADFWALPYGLTRVFLDDIRHQPEAQCEVLPVVNPLEEDEVISVMHEDGAKKAWCRDADVSQFNWSRISADFSAPHTCTEGMTCDGVKDVRSQEVVTSKTSGAGMRRSRLEDTTGATEREVDGQDDVSENGASHRKEATGNGNMHMPDTSDVASSTNVYLRGSWSTSQGKTTMLWSAAAVGILAWVLFVWFYHSTLGSKKRNRRIISMQLSGSADLGSGVAP